MEGGTCQSESKLILSERGHKFLCLIYTFVGGLMSLAVNTSPHLVSLDNKALGRLF